MERKMKTNKNKTTQTLCITILAIAGFAVSVAWAADTINQSIPFTAQSFTGSGCPGSWTGYAKMTNSSDGTFYITPPTNVVSGTLKDASGFAAPYTSVAYVKSRKHMGL